MLAGNSLFTDAHWSGGFSSLIAFQTSCMDVVRLCQLQFPALGRSHNARLTGLSADLAFLIYSPQKCPIKPNCACVVSAGIQLSASPAKIEGEGPLIS